MKKLLISSIAFGLSAIGLLPMEGTAQTLLLSDDFNDRTLGQNVGCPSGTEACFSDWGDNNNGLGGSFTQTYVHTPDRTSPGGVNQTIMDADDPANGENEGIVRFGAIQLDYDFASNADVIAGGGYSLEVDVRRGGGNFVAIHFGADQNFVANTLMGAAFVIQQPETDVSFLLQDDGGGGKRVKFAPFGDNDEVDGAAKVFDIGGLSDEVFDVKIDVSAPNGFDSGDTVTYDVTIDGSLAFSEPIVVDGLFSSYIGFSSNSGGVTGGIFDDLTITAFEDTTPGIDGDYNDNGVVDAADYTIWRDNLGGNSSALSGNGSGAATVVQADYDLWAGQYGATSAPAANAVPEPASAALLLFASLFPSILLRRRD